MESLKPKMSARIGSRWAELVDAFSALTGTRIEPKRGCSVQTIQRVAAICLRGCSGEVLRPEEHSECGSLRLSYTDPVKFVPAQCDLTYDVLTQHWAAHAEELRSRTKCSTLAEFVTVLAEAYGAYKSAVRMNSKIDVMSPATVALTDAGAQYSTIWTPLGLGYHLPTVTPSDREFVYAHLRMSCGALYWKGRDVCIPLPRQDGKAGLLRLDDAQFWRVWSDECAPMLDDYLRRAREMTTTLTSNTSQLAAVDGSLERSVDEALASFMPEIILRHLEVGLYYKTEDKNTSLIGTKLRIRGNRHDSLHLEDWKAVIAEKLVASLDDRYIQPIRQFSNHPGESISCVDLDGIDTEGRHGIELAGAEDEPPMLPPTWSRLLEGVDRKFSIFETDPRMSLLRLAYFIVQCVHDNGRDCRQILCLSGSGHDGKSLLVRLISELIGEGCGTLNPDALDTDSGTYGALNRVLVALPECRRPSEVLRTPFVKAVTGRDTVAVRRLYCMPIEWVPEHTRLIMTTNYKTYVSDENGISRLLPLAMRINYTKDQQETVAFFSVRCADEREQFIQWAFDTLAYYASRRNVRGEVPCLWGKDSMSVITDDDYAQWIRGEFDLSATADWRTIVRDAISACGRDRYQVTLSDEAGDDDESLYQRLASKMLRITGVPEDRVYSSEIIEALQRSTDDPRDPVRHLVKVLGLCGERFANKQPYKSFLRALAGIEGVEKGRDGKKGTYLSGVAFIEDARESEYVF